MAGKKLTIEQIDARMEMYDEAMNHLIALSPDDVTTKEEIVQSEVVIRQIRTLADKWYQKVMKGRK